MVQAAERMTAACDAWHTRNASWVPPGTRNLFLREHMVHHVTPDARIFPDSSRVSGIMGG
jgi:hypothetical protein